MYRHECEPICPILIMLPMMQYRVLYLFEEVGSGGVTLKIVILSGGGGRGIICCQVSFLFKTR